MDMDKFLSDSECQLRRARFRREMRALLPAPVNPADVVMDRKINALLRDFEEVFEKTVFLRGNGEGLRFADRVAELIELARGDLLEHLRQQKAGALADGGDAFAQIAQGGGGFGVNGFHQGISVEQVEKAVQEAIGAGEPDRLRYVAKYLLRAADRVDPTHAPMKVWSLAALGADIPQPPSV